MHSIIRHRQIQRDDPWQPAPDEAPTPLAGPVIVSLARFSDEREALLARGAPLGVRLAPDDDVTALAGSIGELDLVALEFGAVGEGRGYSQARLLRDRLGFRGELRAVGDVSRDRLGFMERCGIDSFELRADQDPTVALAAFDELPLRYQPGADGDDIVARRRGWRQ